MAIDASTEPPLTLRERPVRTLGLTDQFALWANLGVSLLLPVAATFLLVPGMSLGASLVAIAVGTLMGNLLLGLAAAPGAHTGAPAMVLLRGLFGTRGSYVPTVANLLQCVGWATLEIVVIAETADRVVGGGWRWVFVLAAGAVATLMAIRPVAVVAILKRYLVWLALASTVYLFVQVLREDLPGLTDGGWDGFWPAADLVAALSVSWMPLAADYSRQSRTGRDAFWGAALGYATSSAAFFVLGVLALAALGLQPGFDVIDALLAIPAGAVALVILAVDEVDEAFANIYSTAVSAQNVVPAVDRRALAVGVGVIATGLALVLDIVAYESFLFLIGAVFVPLFATFVVDYYVVSRGRWDVSESSRGRPLMLLPWLAGFVTYQLVSPTFIEKWQTWHDWWVARREDLGFDPPSWLGATVASFAVAGLLTLLLGRFSRPRADAPEAEPAARSA